MYTPSPIPTPRTDAEARANKLHGYHEPEYVPAHFAKELERELATVQETLAHELATELCVYCQKVWSPSLVESGTCIFCILKEVKSSRDEYAAKAVKLQKTMDTYGGIEDLLCPEFEGVDDLVECFRLLKKERDELLEHALPLERFKSQVSDLLANRSFTQSTDVLGRLVDAVHKASCWENLKQAMNV